MALPTDMPLEELMELPAMEAPPGVTPNFDDPPNRNGLAIGVLTLFTVISTLGMILRVYAKCYVMRQWKIQECKAKVPGTCSIQDIDGFLGNSGLLTGRRFFSYGIRRVYLLYCADGDDVPRPC